ncbi:MAG TPA: FHA domain-containing protein [Ktedonobacteraceae bacterium]|jgi:predicted component of type VI protein secretion system|nr:FHA domain-containing protein [Ktedonobacteraceae bacterium]
MDAALSGPTGRVELGTTTLTIGRLPANQLVVNDAKASPQHAELRLDSDGYAVVDLGSTEGTFVNEQRLASYTPQCLHTGDSIRIGDTCYIYEVENPPTPTTTTGSLSSLPTITAQDSVLPSAQQKQPEYQGVSPIYSPPAQSGVHPTSQGYSVHSSPLPPAPQSAVVPQEEASNAPLPLSPPQKSHKMLWIIVGAAVIFLVLLGSIVGILFSLNRSTPARTLDAFCSDVRNKNGRDAFNLLSDGLKSQSTDERTLFISAINSGQITGCSYSSPTISDSDANAELTFTAIGGRSQTVTVLLILDSRGVWKINRVQIIQA